MRLTLLFLVWGNVLYGKRKEFLYAPSTKGNFFFLMYPKVMICLASLFLVWGSVLHGKRKEFLYAPSTKGNFFCLMYPKVMICLASLFLARGKVLHGIKSNLSTFFFIKDRILFTLCSIEMFRLISFKWMFYCGLLFPLFRQLVAIFFYLLVFNVWLNKFRLSSFG